MRLSDNQKVLPNTLLLGFPLFLCIGKVCKCLLEQSLEVIAISPAVSVSLCLSFYFAHSPFLEYEHLELEYETNI